MEGEKIIKDLKKVGVEVFKSPMGYYTIKTKRIENKIELVKEVQRLILNNDYSVMSAKLIGDFIKKNLETNREYYLKHKEDFKRIQKEAFKKLPKEVKEKQKEVCNSQA